MAWLKNQTVLQGIAFLLIMVSLPLVVMGGQVGELWLIVGLVVAAIGFLIPPVTKLIPSGDDDEDDGDDGGSDRGSKKGPAHQPGGNTPLTR